MFLFALAITFAIAAMSAWAVSSMYLAQGAVRDAVAAQATAQPSVGRPRDAATARSARSTSEMVVTASVANMSNMATALANAQTSAVTVVPTRGITLMPMGTPSLAVTPSGRPTSGCVNAIVNGDFRAAWPPGSKLATHPASHQ